MKHPNSQLRSVMPIHSSGSRLASVVRESEREAAAAATGSAPRGRGKRGGAGRGLRALHAVAILPIGLWVSACSDSAANLFSELRDAIAEEETRALREDPGEGPVPSEGAQPPGSTALPPPPVTPASPDAGSGPGGSEEPEDGAPGAPGGGAQADAGAAGVDPEPAGPFAVPVAERPESDGTCSPFCGSQGGRCEQGSCIFDCDEEGLCTRPVQIICPEGDDCSIRCAAGSCPGNVICGEEASCTIECAGEGSCEDEVICDGDCRVHCSGDGSCAGGIGGAAKNVELVCSGVGSCRSVVSCEGERCSIECSGAWSCPTVIAYAAENQVSCTGEGSCEERLSCYGNECLVRCAEGACRSGIDCDAFACDVDASAGPDVSLADPTPPDSSY